MKLLSKVLYIVLGIFFLMSCSSRKAEGPTKKIVVWHWMNDRKDALSTLAQKYKEQTGITVEFKLFSPPDIYSQKVIAAARAGNLPEIFGILGEKKTVASFIKAGHILDLTQSMQAENYSWKQRFYPETLAVVTFSDNNFYGVKAGIYAVPMDTTVMQFVYNKSLLRAAGLNPDNAPNTFEEFITYAKKVKEAKKVSGFICGWGEGWLLNCLATEWAINSMGEEDFIKTIKGEIPYTSSKWLDVFSLFAKLRDSGILAPNITTMINKEAEDAFAKGQAAFSFNGSWSINVYKQLTPDLDYAFFALPQVSGKFSVKVWGGSGSSFMVNAHSPNKEEAVKFLQWLTQKEQQEFLIKETNNLPAITGCDLSLSPMLKALTVNFGNFTHPDTWPYNEDSRVIEIINKELQQIIMGIKTPEAAAGEIEEVKQRVLSTK